MKVSDKRIWISGISLILLIVLYVMIFRFSEQEGDVSGSLSFRVSMIWAEFMDQVSGRRLSQQALTQLALYFEHPIRKLAHFAEYACMGILVYGLWMGWSRNLKRIVIPWVFISAALDELHQTFVPGRSGNIPDVFLDTAGGFFACLVLEGIRRVIKRRLEQKA